MTDNSMISSSVQIGSVGVTDNSMISSSVQIGSVGVTLGRAADIVLRQRMHCTILKSCYFTSNISFHI